MRVLQRRSSYCGRSNERVIERRTSLQRIACASCSPTRRNHYRQSCPCGGHPRLRACAASGLAELMTRLRGIALALIVLEATGGLETVVVCRSAPRTCIGCITTQKKTPSTESKTTLSRVGLRGENQVGFRVASSKAVVESARGPIRTCLKVPLPSRRNSSPFRRSNQNAPNSMISGDTSVSTPRSQVS
jgi:hypothetical protein